MERPARERGIGRWQFSHASLGFAEGPALALRATAPTSDPPLVSYPVGAAGSTVLVGITAPLTDSYPADGKEAQCGDGLAMTRLQAASAFAGKRGVGGKSVPGETIRHGISDSETKPTVAVPALVPVVIGKAPLAVQDPGDAHDVMDVASREPLPPITEAGG
jgi:branched-chain amino acid transport system substrate-binding protein